MLFSQKLSLRTVSGPTKRFILVNLKVQCFTKTFQRLQRIYCLISIFTNCFNVIYICPSLYFWEPAGNPFVKGQVSNSHRNDAEGVSLGKTTNAHHWGPHPTTNLESPLNRCEGCNPRSDNFFANAYMNCNFYQRFSRQTVETFHYVYNCSCSSLLIRKSVFNHCLKMIPNIFRTPMW